MAQTITQRNRQKIRAARTNPNRTAKNQAKLRRRNQLASSLRKGSGIPTKASQAAAKRRAK